MFVLTWGPVPAAYNHIADAVCAFERATQQITTGLDRPRPRNDHRSEHEIGSRLEALPSALLDQFIADPTEAVPRLVVAESRAGDGSQPDIGEARRVAVATLEAEIDRATADQDDADCYQWRVQGLPVSSGCPGWRAMRDRSIQAGRQDPRSHWSRAATRSVRIRVALPRRSDAVTIPRPCPGDSRDRRRSRGWTGRASGRDPCASRQRPLARRE